MGITKTLPRTVQDAWKYLRGDRRDRKRTWREVCRVLSFCEAGKFNWR